MEIEKHEMRNKCFNKSKPFYLDFLPQKIFKDDLKLQTSSKYVIQVDWLFTIFLLFLKVFPTNTNNLSGVAILNFRRYFRSSRPSLFYKIGVLRTLAKFLGKPICWSLFLANLKNFSRKFYLSKNWNTYISQLTGHLRTTSAVIWKTWPSNFYF